MKVFGYIVAFVLAILASSIWAGFVLSILWEWFIETTFSLPGLNIPTAIGLVLIVNYLTHQDTETPDSGNSLGAKFWQGVANALLKPTMARFVGWIVTLFM